MVFLCLKVRTGLLVTLVFYSSFSSIVMIFAEPLVDSMVLVSVDSVSGKSVKKRQV